MRPDRRDLLRAMANNEFGAWSDLDAWQSNYDAGPWGAYREGNPNGEIAYSVTPAGPNGQRGSWFRDPNWTPWAIGVNASDAVTAKLMEMTEDIFTNRDNYAWNFFGGPQGETWEENAAGYSVPIAGTGAAKDTATATALGVRMFVGHVPHIVPPVDKVYIAPNRHQLQNFLEQNQVKGPGYGFVPSWNEQERALIANIQTIEQEFAWQAITGQVNIDSAWAGYVRRMNDAGLTALLETVARQGM